MPRILIADDHVLVAEALRTLLSTRHEHVEVVCRTEDLLSRARQADLVLLDVSMPGIGGIEAARRLREGGSEVRILFLSMHDDEARVLGALRAGGNGYLLKDADAAEMFTAIDEVMRGSTFLSPRLTSALVTRAVQPELAAPAGARRSALTPRQIEVLRLVAEGKTLKEIAAALHVSPKTVEFHKARLTAQLGLHTTAELTRYAVAQGLVPVEPAAAARR